MGGADAVEGGDGGGTRMMKIVRRGEGGGSIMRWWGLMGFGGCG